MQKWQMQRSSREAEDLEKGSFRDSKSTPVQDLLARRGQLALNLVA
jgi:hypothetical protein